MNNRIILLTGGTGFLGKEIINSLINNGYCVRVLTRDSSRFNNSEFVHYVNGDIIDVKTIEKALIGCYGLIHSAGEKTDTRKMEQVNVQGTKNICDIAINSSIKYFCFVSSVGVIGLTNKKSIDENTPCNPINEYEKTKLKAEKYVTTNFLKTDCSSVILRPTNIFGSKHLSFSNSLSQKFKRWIKGNELVNYVYVKDVAAASVFFLNKKQFKNEIFIVNGMVYNYKYIYETINKQKLLFYPSIVFPWFLRYLRHGKNNIGNKTYSSEKLKNHGFTPIFGLNKGIEDTLKKGN